MTSSSIAVVSVNYKTPDLAIESIKSVLLQKNELPNINMYIVDNDSRDGSLDKLQTFASDNKLTWVNVIDAKTNAGYAAGNNVALRKILKAPNKPDYIWFLNPDTCLRENAAINLIQYMEEHGVSVVGSRLEDQDGTPQISNFNFPGVLSELASGARFRPLDTVLKNKLVRREVTDEPEACDWLAGASLMMKREVIESIGLMDEIYFLYFEELDYCLLANRSGYQCWYVPDSKVFHAVGASTGISDKRKAAPRRPKYWFDSRRRYFLKNFGPLKLALADTLFILGYSSWLARSFLFAKKKLEIEPPYFLRDFIRHSFLFRGF